jgi:hypothetical protein
MTIIQKPNPSLSIALVSYAISAFTSGILHRMGSTVFFIAISIWSYQEIVSGVNWFRRILGIVVLLSTAYSLFHQLTSLS